MSNIALQLYTLRDLTSKDFKGTMEKVADIGYTAVELCNYGGMSPQELRDFLQNLGIQAVSGHVALERLEHELDVVIEESKTIGLEYVVCPWLPEERRKQPEGVAQLAAVLQQIGERCKEAGLKFGYHNHDFEFVKVNESFLLDELFAKTDADTVQAELDLYWVHHAGQDPISYIQKYANRVDLLHMKDASKVDGSFAEVGQGSFDWGAIISAAKAAGTKWYIVEQDVCPGNPLESARTSFDYLTKAL